MAPRSVVRLPQGAEPPYHVYVNGVPQREGVDYRIVDASVVFDRELAKEGRLGFWRWLLMFLAIRGTYRRNDSVDLHYRAGGRDRVAVALDIESGR